MSSLALRLGSLISCLLFSSVSHAGLLGDLCRSVFNSKSYKPLNEAPVETTDSEIYSSTLEANPPIDLSRAIRFANLSVPRKIAFLRSENIKVVLVGTLNEQIQNEPDLASQSLHVIEEMIEQEALGLYMGAHENPWINGDLAPRMYQGFPVIVAITGDQLDNTLMHEFLHHEFISARHTSSRDEILSQTERLKNLIEISEGIHKNFEMFTQESEALGEFPALGAEYEQTKWYVKNDRHIERYSMLVRDIFKSHSARLKIESQNAKEEFLVAEAFIVVPELVRSTHYYDHSYSRMIYEFVHLYQNWWAAKPEIFFGEDTYGKILRNIPRLDPRVRLELQALHGLRSEVRKKLLAISAFLNKVGTNWLERVDYELRQEIIKNLELSTE